MIDAFVVDASTAVAWVHRGQATAESDAWLLHAEAGADLVVPALWPLEVTNALIALQRRRKLTPHERDQALETLGALALTLDHEAAARAFTELAELAVRESMTMYDTTYLELALRRALPLACKDGPLRAAASRLRVRVTP